MAPKRSCAKSDLLKVIDLEVTSADEAYTGVEAFVLDIMASVRTVGIFTTIEELIWKVLNTVPKQIKRVDLLADSYRQISWKNQTHDSRGTTGSVIVKSAKTKIRDINIFLRNNSNKSQMIDIFFEWVVEHKLTVLSFLKTTQLYMSKEDWCVLVTAEETRLIEELASSHEEADFRLMVHASHSLLSGLRTIIRSPSGDTDILIMAISLFATEKTMLLIDSGTGTNQKIFHLKDISIDEDERKALIGFHAFTGCDYSSSFFRKGKPTCWKLMLTKARFIKAMQAIGENEHPDGPLHDELVKYVCALYGSKIVTDIDELRYRMFIEKNGKEDKCMDLSTMPPCKRALNLHI